MKLYHAMWGEDEARGRVTCEGSGEAVEEVTLVAGEGRGEKNELVTEPKEKHAQQNLKNNEQNEANDQQRQNRTEIDKSGGGARGASHSPRSKPG